MAHWFGHRNWPRSVFTWEHLGLLVLFVVAVFSLFHNLDINPRSWHDEGSALSVSKTLAKEGVYAVKTSDGYQTFGPVQSVGPTVLVPIALSYKLFGTGLVQGRAVIGIYALLALAIFYLSARELFGKNVALPAVVMLLAAPGAEFLLYSRQAIGEIPALGFFLAGWLVWAKGVRLGWKWLYVVAGVLIGAAMVTKSQYMVMGLGALAVLFLLDLFYYRQRNLVGLVIVGLAACACLAGWHAWQWSYFGLETYQDNANKLRLLASSATGFRLRNVLEAVRFMTGSGSGHFYAFWGFPTMVYVFLLCKKRTQSGYRLAFLFVFVCLWLGYYFFVTIPFVRSAFPPMAIMALFVTKLFVDLAESVIASRAALWARLKGLATTGVENPPETLALLGALVAVVTMSLWTGYELQKAIRAYVLDKVGIEEVNIVSAPQLMSPFLVAEFLSATVDQEAVIDTWERELDILTDHNYHFPDQSFLAYTHRATYLGGPQDYVLGSEYFSKIRPLYVIVGFYSRFNQIYDMDFLVTHYDLVKSIGAGDWRYDIYKMKQGVSLEVPQ